MDRDLLAKYWARAGWTLTGDSLEYQGKFKCALCLPNFYEIEAELMAKGWRFAMRDGRYIAYRADRCIGSDNRDDLIVTVYLETSEAR